MESARNFNALLTDWLTQLMSGQRVAFTQSAQRFAALLSSEAELEAVRPDAADSLAAPATLKIASGLHTGARLKLTVNQYLIGCAQDCDIVLRDSHIAEHHCKLIRGWAGFSVRDLRAASTDLAAPTEVKYDGGSIEVQYEIGGLRFSVCQPPPAAMSREAGTRWHFPGSRALLLAAVVGVLVAAVALAAFGQAGKHQTGIQAHQPGVSGSGLDEKAAARLVEEARLALADDRVRVEVHEGRLLVEGTTAQAALKARIQALATDMRGAIPVEDRTIYVPGDTGNEGPGPLPIRVQSVLVGQPGYFITDTGARYFVGGVLPDGAEVVSINATEIQFLRGGHPVVYRLQ
jgi:Inner membrane component of T3SS, cytoplasmic domain